MKDLKISKKKPSYPVSDELHKYLSEYNRNIKQQIIKIEKNIEIIKYIHILKGYLVDR